MKETIDEGGVRKAGEKKGLLEEEMVSCGWRRQTGKRLDGERRLLAKQ